MMEKGCLMLGVLAVTVSFPLDARLQPPVNIVKDLKGKHVQELGYPKTGLSKENRKHYLKWKRMDSRNSNTILKDQLADMLETKKLKHWRRQHENTWQKDAPRPKESLNRNLRKGEVGMDLNNTDRVEKEVTSVHSELQDSQIAKNWEGTHGNARGIDNSKPKESLNQQLKEVEVGMHVNNTRRAGKKVDPSVRSELQRGFTFDEKGRVVKVIQSYLNEITSQSVYNPTDRLLKVLLQISSQDVESLKKCLDVFKQEVEESARPEIDLSTQDKLTVMNILQTILDVLQEKSISVQIYLLKRLTNISDNDRQCLRKVKLLFSRQVGRKFGQLGDISERERLQDCWGQIKYNQDKCFDDCRNSNCLLKESTNGKLKKAVVVLAPNRIRRGKNESNPSIDSQIQQGLSIEDKARVKKVIQSFLNVVESESEYDKTIVRLLLVVEEISHEDFISLRKCLNTFSKEMTESIRNPPANMLENHSLAQWRGEHDLSSGETLKVIYTIQTILDVVNAATSMQFYLLEQLKDLLNEYEHKASLKKVVLSLTRDLDEYMPTNRLVYQKLKNKIQDPLSSNGKKFGSEAFGRSSENANHNLEWKSMNNNHQSAAPKVTPAAVRPKMENTRYPWSTYGNKFGF